MKYKTVDNKNNNKDITKANLIKELSKECNIVETIEDILVKAFKHSRFLTGEAKSIVIAIIKSELANPIDENFVKDTYNNLENKIFEILSTTSENNTKENPLKIRLFEGITIEGIYNKPKEKKLNYSEDVITTKGSIKAKVNVTRYYNEKLNMQTK